MVLMSGIQKSGGSSWLVATMLILPDTLTLCRHAAYRVQICDGKVKPSYYKLLALASSQSKQVPRCVGLEILFVSFLFLVGLGFELRALLAKRAL
jgi:hypothetical protein